MFGYPYMLNGMNECGLSVMANMNLDSTKKAVKYPYPLPDYAGIESTLVVRIILETCKDAAEAKNLLSKISVQFSGPPVHYLIGDDKGNSFIAEIKPEEKGKVKFVERQADADYQIVTNFSIDTKGYNGNMGYKEGRCIRYETLEKRFNAMENKMVDHKFIESALNDVKMSNETRIMNQGMGKQSNTVLRSIYDLNNKTAYYYTSEDNFKEYYIIDLSRSKE
jgi:predicted choloylglycine hydrolase